MILPPPACFITGWTACEHRNALVRLVVITLFHSASSSACGGLRMLMPALLTRMSIPPSSSLTRATIAATAALSVTSATTEMALAPLRSNSTTAAADFASLRPTIAIAAPASANPLAMPSPMPPLPPVITATLPMRSNGSVFMVVVRLAQDVSRALALPDQDQADRAQRRTISRPLDLVDHEARCRPGDDAEALADPEQADRKRNQPEYEKQLAHRLSPVVAVFCVCGKLSQRVPIAVD